jgi:hypothetical protein
MYAVEGSCHCRNVAVTMQLTQLAQNYRPRACDCGFCTRHGAAYVSDARGSVAIRIHDQRAVGKYRQGSQLAEFLLCRNCGVLIGAVYQGYAAINANIVDAPSAFGDPLPVSPKQLASADKSQRWQRLWFPQVTMSDHGA